MWTSDSLYHMQSSGHNKVLWMFFVIDDRSYLEVQTVFMCKRKKSEVHRMAPHPLLRMRH